MLEGVIIKPLRRFADERGFFTEVFRSDWTDLLGDDNTMQANLSITYPGVVRAWHRHERGQTDYLVVLRGTAKICAYDEATKELDEIISSGETTQVVRVPGHYWHGFKVVGGESLLLVYLVNRLYNHNNPDELRRPWNDPTIVPKKINGKEDDPRCNRPWDWLYLPFK